MSKGTFDIELKKAQKKDMEAKKTQLINKIHYEDRKVISNFHMIKLSDILMIKETIRSLENGVARFDKKLHKLY
jgi:hypothetical protein